MGKFIEIYEQNLIDAKKQYIESSNFSSKPIMTTGVISPESTICIQPIFGIEFGLDKAGTNTILEMLENKWDAKTENERKNLLGILTDIYTITEEYLGGHGIPSVRQNAYLKADNNRLTLSEIQEKNIGLCAERAAIGHQMFSIIEKAGLTNFTSFLTISHLTVDTREPHSFIVLKHNTDSSKQYIFDIENPVKYMKTSDSKPMLGVALYPMTQEEFEAFQEGKSIAPQTIYEQFGMIIADTKRYYGDEEITINKIDKDITNDVHER